MQRSTGSPAEGLHADRKAIANLVPEKYRDPKTTPLSVEVKAGGKNDFTLEMKD